MASHEYPAKVWTQRNEVRTTTNTSKSFITLLTHPFPPVAVVKVPFHNIYYGGIHAPDMLLSIYPSRSWLVIDLTGTATAVDQSAPAGFTGVLYRAVRPFPDSASTPVATAIGLLATTIHNHLETPNAFVLIHCRHGLNRYDVS